MSSWQRRGTREDSCTVMLALSRWLVLFLTRPTIYDSVYVFGQAFILLSFCQVFDVVPWQLFKCNKRNRVETRRSVMRANTLCGFTFICLTMSIIFFFFQILFFVPFKVSILSWSHVRVCIQFSLIHLFFDLTVHLCG